ncbi:MAG: hypothetical protein DRP74_05180 [Candidatus Omnitrophota bacterium]|nr:MAG: hypothetical protein DRP74_05180 [Candidatus Omnitrophota bacterium]
MPEKQEVEKPTKPEPEQPKQEAGKPKPEAEKHAVQTEEPKAQAQAAKPAEKPKPVVEKQTNCPACNKPIKKLKRYYRDGIFYCNKKCWTKSVKEKKKKDENA